MANIQANSTSKNNQAVNKTLNALTLLQALNAEQFVQVLEIMSPVGPSTNKPKTNSPDAASLSRPVQLAIGALRSLHKSDVRPVIEFELGRREAATLDKSRPSTLDGASVALIRGIVKFEAPDQSPVVMVDVTGKKNTSARFFLSGGASGKMDLKGYGKKVLDGLVPMSSDAFLGVVDTICNASLGKSVKKGVLQTENEALRDAFSIAKNGVSTTEGVWMAKFKLDKAGAVAGFKICEKNLGWSTQGMLDHWALYGPRGLKIRVD